VAHFPRWEAERISLVPGVCSVYNKVAAQVRPVRLTSRADSRVLNRGVLTRPIASLLRKNSWPDPRRKCSTWPSWRGLSLVPAEIELFTRSSMTSWPTSRSSGTGHRRVEPLATLSRFSMSLGRMRSVKGLTGIPPFPMPRPGRKAPLWWPGSLRRFGFSVLGFR